MQEVEGVADAGAQIPGVGHATRVADQVNAGEQLVFHEFHGDIPLLHDQAGLGQVGAIVDGVLKTPLAVEVGFEGDQGPGGLEVHVGPLPEVVREEALQGIFPVGEEFARCRQGGQGVLEFGLRLFGVQGRQVPDLDAPLCFGKELLSQLQRLFLDADEFQAGLEVVKAQLDGQHRFHDLETEGLLGNFQVLAPGQDRFPVLINPGIFEEVLLEGDPDLPKVAVGVSKAARETAGEGGDAAEISPAEFCAGKGAEFIAQADRQVPP